MRRILNSQLFYSDHVIGRKVRSPVDLADHWILYNDVPMANHWRFERGEEGIEIQVESPPGAGRPTLFVDDGRVTRTTKSSDEAAESDNDEPGDEIAAMHLQVAGGKNMHIASVGLESQ